MEVMLKQTIDEGRRVHRSASEMATGVAASGQAAISKSMLTLASCSAVTARAARRRRWRARTTPLRRVVTGRVSCETSAFPSWEKHTLRPFA